MILTGNTLIVLLYISVYSLPISFKDFMFFKRCLILSTFCLYSCGADFIVEMSLKISSNVLFIGKIQPTSAFLLVRQLPLDQMRLRGSLKLNFLIRYKNMFRAT